MSLAAPAVPARERTFSAAHYELWLPIRPIAIILGAAILAAQHNLAVHRYLADSLPATVFVWFAGGFLLIRGAWSVRTVIDIVESEIRRTTMLFQVIPLWGRRYHFSRITAIDICHTASRVAEDFLSAPRGASFGHGSAFIYGAVLALILGLIGELTGGLIDVGRYELRLQTRDHRSPLVYRSIRREETVQHAENLARILNVHLT